MNKNIKKLPGSKIEFKISVPFSDWEKYLDQAVKEVSEEIKIQGFRPGKAPRNLVEQKVGKGVLLNNAAEKAVQKSYVDFIRDLIEKEKVEVIGRPEVTIEKIEEGQDLEYKAVAAIMPEIALKDQYKNEIKKVNHEYAEKKADISEEDLKLELDKLANSRVKLVTVAREAKNNDSVEVDFSVLVDGVPIENGTSKKHPLILGRGAFIPGFEDNLIGMKEGEEKEFELEFPKDYHKKDLAGRMATFKVKMSLVQERQAPEINDDFAKSLGEFENLEKLKASIKDGMQHEKEHKIKEERRTAYLEKILKNLETELPDVLVHEELHKMLHEFEMQIQSMGMTLEDYLSKLGKKREDLEKEWEEQAKKRILSALSLKKIAELENIEATSKEVEEEINKTLQHYKNIKDLEKNIDMQKLYQHAKGMLENEKVFELLEKI